MMFLNIFVYPYIFLNIAIYMGICVSFHENNNGSGLFGSDCPFSCLTSEFLGVSEDRKCGPKNI